MKVCRDAMMKMKIHIAYNPRHPVYREAEWLKKDIDNLAGILTRHADYFNTRGHGINIGIKPSTG